MKRFLWILGVVSILGLASCGGGSSKEAKELLQKILTVVGIPQEFITNICQTSNNSDVCEGITLHGKIGEESSRTRHWKNIKNTGEGQYLLETDTPCEPILLELKDSDVVDDDGEFMLKFSGVEFGQTTKELSILEAMVDAEYISAFSVNSIKKLNSSEAQNSFYSILYKDLKTNLNTLRAEGLTKIQAIRGTLNEMANELLAYGVNNTLPARINGCNSDSVCIGQEMEKLSSRLIIDTNESAEIVNTQKDNTAPMSVRNVSCEEEKSDSTRLTKMTDYNSDGSKLWEGNLIYENDKLKKWVWNDYEDEGESGIWIYEYSTDKIKIVDSDNSSSWEYLYKNSVITEWNWYNEGTLFFSDKIVEYDEQNRPIKIEQRLSLEADIDYIETYTYDGEYLIHNESIDQDIEYSDFSDYSDYKYDRNYKCITWKDLTGTPLWNNQECINWISKTTTEKENDEKDINTQEIIYNDKELPTRIDSYDTNGEQSEHTYSIFEYSD